RAQSSAFPLHLIELRPLRAPILERDQTPFLVGDDLGRIREHARAFAAGVEPHLDDGERIISGSGLIDLFPYAHGPVGRKDDAFASVFAGLTPGEMQVPAKTGRAADVADLRRLLERFEESVRTFVQ